ARAEDGFAPAEEAWKHSPVTVRDGVRARPAGDTGGTRSRTRRHDPNGVARRRWRAMTSTRGTHMTATQFAAAHAGGAQ
ncbi:MAG: hypothetical protein ACR2I3_22335, partial [Rhodococcus sp. (in: high G+C Gram-positive bacteria)]|uniref:hypothetical protein n=1 Tax=Rhodococcus sp. TaxID=1831 RepID=UPI003D9BE08C